MNGFRPPLAQRLLDRLRPLLNFLRGSAKRSDPLGHYTDERMHHKVAENTHAVQRYLTGDLSADERDRFEEHLFDCPACIAELRETQVFMANLKAVLAEESFEVPVNTAPTWIDRIRGWLIQPAPALAGALGLLVAYQNLVQIPNFRRAVAPQAVVAEVVPPETRGEIPVIRPHPGDRFFSITMDINLTPAPDVLYWEVRKMSGETVQTGSAPGRPSLTLLLPVGNFSSGRYVVETRGQTKVPASGPAQPPERHRFEFQP